MVRLMTLKISTVVFFILLTGSLSGPAHAYIDPGTGALFAQAVVAILGGGLLFLRQIKSGLMRFLTKLGIIQKKNNDVSE